MIRKAKDVLKEREAIYQLINAAAKEGKIMPRSRNEIKRVVDGFFIAIEDDKIVGCCALEIYSKKMAEVRSLAVHPAYQRKGWGVNLVKACVQEAKKKRIYEVLAITDKDSFFEKMGFIKCLNGQFPLFFRP